MNRPDLILCSPVRTAIGACAGTLKDMPAPDFGAGVVSETLKRAKLDTVDVETVVMGEVIQAGTRMNPARQAAIKGGIPASTPAMTVNRVCGSGAQAIASVAQEIMLRRTRYGVAGGMENMDHAPYLLFRG